MDHHDELQRQYLEGELTGTDSNAFLAGLPEEERRELEALRQVMAQLEALPPVEAPPGMLARIEAAIAAEPVYTAARPAPQPSKPQLSWTARLTGWLKSPPVWGWMGAGFSAAMALMLLVGHLRQPPAIPPLDAMKTTPAQVAASQPPAVSAAQAEAVTFKLYAPQAQSVAVIGEFNGWGAQPAAVLKRQANGQWQATVPLPPGQYQYAFLVNGQKVVADPQAMAYVQDDYGHRNAVLTLL
jgi:hypothetical protein